MGKFRVRFEYEVTLPEKGTPEYDNLVLDLFDPNGGALEESVLPDDPNEREVYIEDSLIYYLVEASHVGDHTERVELVDDSMEVVDSP